MRASILVLFIVATVSLCMAQAPPQGINYQAVVYDIEGSQMPGVDAYDLIMANKQISVRFTILQSDPNGLEIYKESHSTTTDEYGLFSLVIGQGTQQSAGDFSSIDWGSGYHFLKVDIDKTGGSNFATLSNQQFWSVPYALYAAQAGNGIESIVDNGDGTISYTYQDGTTESAGPFGWTLNGNSGTDDNVNFIGTIDQADLIFKTNDLERMRIMRNGRVGINTSAVHQTAALEVTSNNKGFLPPRLSKDQRDLIPSPAQGLIIYNTTDSVAEYFNGECWLPTYAYSCDDCLFDLLLPLSAGNIDRVLSDTIAIEVQVAQNGPTPQTVAFFTLNNLPPLTTTYFTSDTLTGNGSTYMVVTTSIFDEPGMYPIAIQAICGNTIRTKIFYLTIDSCYRVTVNSAVSQYNLQQVNSLPGVGTPICVVLDVTNTGQLTSTNASIPTYTSGPLDPQSHVGIRNYGAFLSRGGNGGDGGSLSTFGSLGQTGGNAINMTTKTSILNYGFIYGGGGGGGSVGLSQDIDIPLFGTWTLAIGAGGGGGCALGQGGGTGGNIIGFWDNGQSATSGINAQPGQGGEINLPIPIPLGPVTITINPDVEGGEGGNYGLQGTSGNLTINISATIPIIGTINIPTPAITNFPAGGEEGFAVKKNGQILNGVPVGNFQLNNLKGKVND